MMDFHVHTDFSDGANSPEQMIDAAVRLGVLDLCITDHYDEYDPAISNPRQNPAGLRLHFDRIRAYSSGKPIRVYCGVETSADSSGALRLPAEVSRMCDIIITSVHYVDYIGPLEKGCYFNDGYWEAYKNKLLALAGGAGDVLGHPEGYLPIHPMHEDGTTYDERLAICASISERYFDAAFVDAVGKALLRSGKAYELHGVSGTPREWVVGRLHKAGVRFSIGSDAHTAGQLDSNRRALELQKTYGLSMLVPGAKPASRKLCKGDT